MTTDKTIHADAVVVGFGRGGKIAALQLGKAGKTVVIVEQSDQMYGGTCPNVGCVPTKMLVHFSGQRRPGDTSQDWYEHAVNGVRDLTTAFRNGNFDALNSAETTTVITGRASFEDAHTIGVGEGDDRLRITAETIIVNTGSQPLIPPIPGLRESAYLHTNVELIHRTDLPERLAIIGGGYLGLEFASIYNRFGSKVTILEDEPRLLDREDDDVAEAAVGILADEGVELVTGARVVEVRDNASTVRVVYEREGVRHEVEADGVLAAVGRTPATKDLGLDSAGVKLDERGAVVVDDTLRTSQPHIFAVGDVNGGPQFTYISQDDGFIVADQLLGKDERRVSDRGAVPQVLFMTPPLATVGLTEKQARAEGWNITVAREAVADIVAMPRAYVVEETRGLMKFVVDADTDQILGAALLSIDAQELINTVALAMRHGITATELRQSIYTHPSSTEAFNGVFGAIVSESVIAAG
jgi:pyruvate/2-oxoglutarate dehydrogenase complex dihydrolipoamide dehydrogenase (E3) component